MRDQHPKGSEKIVGKAGLPSRIARFSFMPQIPVLGGTQAEPLAEGGPCGRTGDLRPAASGATMYLCKVDTLQERNSILKLTEARQPQCSS